MITKEFTLHNLILYRNILEDKIIKKIQLLQDDTCPKNMYYELCSELFSKAEQLHLEGNLLRNYFIYLIAKDENIFSKTVEKNKGTLACDSTLYQAALHDMQIIHNFISHDLHILSKKENSKFLLDFVPSSPSTTVTNHSILHPYLDLLNGTSTPSSLVEKLLHYYSSYGCGIMSDYNAFRWNSTSGLTGIKNFDQITFDDITGYEQQKETLVQNTCAFLAERPANHILLIGSPGTGKSSSVKALINEPFARNLRLVEVSKHELKSLHKLMDCLRDHSQKFIIFLDDLSFEEFEVEYKYLKSIIDGGIEITPKNVLIYATSNRMHLIKESWDDRKGNTDDVHRFDTVNEKLSLSERFGITLTYLSPNQIEYLAIVEQMASRNNISLPLEQLKAEALKWERRHNGRSGRTVQQFINHLLSHQS